LFFDPNKNLTSVLLLWNGKRNEIDERLVMIVTLPEGEDGEWLCRNVLNGTDALSLGQPDAMVPEVITLQ
jgi:hypothetical protein